MVTILGVEGWDERGVLIVRERLRDGCGRGRGGGGGSGGGGARERVEDVDSLGGWSSSSRKSAIERCAVASGTVAYESARSAFVPTTMIISSEVILSRSSGGKTVVRSWRRGEETKTHLRANT